MEPESADNQAKAANKGSGGWASPRMVLRRILMLDDTHHSIALGTTIGMFIGMTPTVGIQMVLVVLFAFLTRAFLQFNRVAALLTVYISNPLTVVPIYWFNYLIGTLFVEGNASWETFKLKLGTDSALRWSEKFHWLFVEVGWPLIVGSLVVATVCSLVTYPAMLRLLAFVHNRRHVAQPAVAQSDVDVVKNNVAKTDSNPSQSSVSQPTENHNA